MIRRKRFGKVVILGALVLTSLVGKRCNQVVTEIFTKKGKLNISTDIKKMLD